MFFFFPFPRGTGGKVKQSTSTKKCWPLKSSQRQLFDKHSNHQCFFVIFFFIFCLTLGGHILQAVGFIWLVRVFEIPVGSRHESCTCQARWVFDLHCANRRLRLCQVIILLFYLRRYLSAIWNNSTICALTLTNWN